MIALGRTRGDANTKAEAARDAFCAPPAPAAGAARQLTRKCKCPAVDGASGGMCIQEETCTNDFFWNAAVHRAMYTIYTRHFNTPLPLSA